MRTLLARCAIFLAVALPVYSSGCHEQASLPGEETAPDHPGKITPPASVPTYSVWIDASGLGDATIRLSIGGRKALDVHAEGRVLALAGLAEGSKYSIRIFKTPELLTCSLTDGAHQADMVEGQVGKGDLTVRLDCLADDVRLAELSLHTLDARLSPSFEPATLEYEIEGYFVNQKMWLSAAPAHAEAVMRIRLDGETVHTGAAALELPMSEVPELLEIELSAPSGSSRVYRLRVARRDARTLRSVVAVEGDDSSIPIDTVAVSDRYLVVSAPAAHEHAGEVDVFRRTPEGWVHDATLKPTREGTADPFTGGASFGKALSLSGDWLAVGAPFYTEAPPEEFTASQGLVYVYQRTAADWELRAQLAPPERRAHDCFGTGLALSGDTLVIGNPRRTALNEGGVAELYRRAPDGSWSWQETLQGEGTPWDEFGEAVVSDDALLAIGAPGETQSATEDSDDSYLPRGSIYLFALGATGVTPQGKVSNPSLIDTSKFGHVFALRAGLLAAGATDDTSETVDPQTAVEHDGAVYVYHGDQGVWSRVGRLAAPQQPPHPGGDPPAGFGCAVALTADALWVGASSDALSPEYPAQSGVVYRYALTEEGVNAIAEVAPLVPLEGGTGLGSELAASPDGVVCVSEPHAKPEDGMFKGRATLLH